MDSLTQASLGAAVGVAVVMGRRTAPWKAALWGAAMGTHLWPPFYKEAVGLGSVFIIDPLYTVPLLLGLAAALFARGQEPANVFRFKSGFNGPDGDNGTC